MGTAGRTHKAEASWDFFLSYTKADQKWAEWVAWQLEAAGYRVLFQKWDFVPGSHWTTRIAEGITSAERTLAILSRAYLNSVYGRAEWQAAYRADPQGFTRKLIPVRVEDCDRPDLLGEVVSFDLFDCPHAETARRRLLDKIAQVCVGRAKPLAEPPFPDRGQLPAPASQRRTTAVVISAIAGKAGVGKTALTVHAAHLLSREYTDGQLYVNLRGAGPERLEPSAVLAEFLRALGLEGRSIPDGIHERARLYRAGLAYRHILVVLDNASDERQVRPLMPGSPTCAVLVTSRRQLGLEGVHRIPLDVLEPDVALELLSRICGQERVMAEVEAAKAIVRHCGYLPLAVRIAGARLAIKSHWPICAATRVVHDRTCRPYRCGRGGS